LQLPFAAIDAAKVPFATYIGMHVPWSQSNFRQSVSIPQSAAVEHTEQIPASHVPFPHGVPPGTGTKMVSPPRHISFVQAFPSLVGISALLERLAHVWEGRRQSSTVQALLSSQSAAFSQGMMHTSLLHEPVRAPA
jgi:hypothetical protein